MVDSWKSGFSFKLVGLAGFFVVFAGLFALMSSLGGVGSILYTSAAPAGYYAPAMGISTSVTYALAFSLIQLILGFGLLFYAFRIQSSPQADKHRSNVAVAGVLSILVLLVTLGAVFGSAFTNDSVFSGVISLPALILLLGVVCGFVGALAGAA